MTITVFHDASGEITYFAESEDLTPDDIADATPVGGGYIEVDDYPMTDLQWVDGGAIADRPALTIDDAEITADGVDSTWFEVPSDTVISVRRADSDDLLANETSPAAGLVVIASTIVGTYNVEIEPPWPYQAGTVALEIVSPEDPPVSPDTPPGSPATVVTISLGIPAITGLTAIDKPKFNRSAWDDSAWPFHDSYELTRYESYSDALADIDGETIGPILESFYKDADDLPDGNVWYRVNDVDDLGNRSPKSAPVSVAARGVKAGDVDQTPPAVPTMTLVGYGDDFDEDGTIDSGLIASITHPNTGVEIGNYILRIQRADASGGPWADWGGPITVPAEDVADTLVSVSRIKANAKKWFRARARAVAKLSGKRGPWTNGGAYTAAVRPSTATGYAGQSVAAPSVSSIANGYVIIGALGALSSALFKEMEILVDGVTLIKVPNLTYQDMTAREIGAQPVYTIKLYDKVGNVSNISTGKTAPEFRATIEAEISRDAIIPSKATMRDYLNAVRDPDCLDLDCWTETDLVQVVDTPGSWDVARFSRCYLERTSLTNTTHISTLPDIPAPRDSRLRVQAVLSPGAGQTADISLYCQKYTIDGAGDLVPAGVPVLIQTRSGQTGWEYYSGSLYAGSSVTAVQLLAVATTASGPTTLRFSSPLVHPVLDEQWVRPGSISVFDEAWSPGSYGSFGASLQNIQGVTAAHGENAVGLLILGSFQNTSGAVREFETYIYLGGTQIGSAPTQKVADGGYGSIFVKYLGTAGFSSSVSLRVQCSTTGNNVAARKLIVLSMKR